MRHPRSVLSLLLLSACAPAIGCWEQAARAHGVSPDLLHAVAQVESSLNPAALNRSHVARTGSYDIGLMQINSSHLRRLARLGITRQDLRDPCINLHVGAWLMADSFGRHGVTWNAVGAYNAACSQLRGRACIAARARYAWRVYRRLAANPPGTYLTTVLGPRPATASATAAHPGSVASLPRVTP